MSQHYDVPSNATIYNYMKEVAKPVTIFDLLDHYNLPYTYYLGGPRVKVRAHLKRLIHQGYITHDSETDLYEVIN